MSWTPTRKEYYADPAVGSSALRDFITSSLLFWHRYVAGDLQVEVTDAMDKGSLADMLLTEPEHVESHYQVTDLARKGTKAWEAEEAAAEGRTLLKRDLWDQAEAIAQAVRDHPLASTLLLEGELQAAHRWEDVNGVTCRYRVDSLKRTNQGLVNVDLKVWSWTDPEGVRRAVYNQGAHIQAALYERGIIDSHQEDPLTILVIANQSPPHEVTVYQIGEEYLAIGRRQVQRGLERLGDLLANHREDREAWMPDHCRTINLIQPPGWVARKEEE